MNRLQRRFDELSRSSRKALIPYITAGDPAPTATVRLLHALVRGGADILELGVPFSDPMADGPVIQAACERALAQGTSLRDTLRIVQAFRSNDSATPIVLMGYLNPVETMGFETFTQAAAEAGVDGVLTVDMTAEESGELLPTLRAHGLEPVFLLSPTTSEARIRSTCEAAGGYLYYVSLKGVTGAQSLDANSIAPMLERIRHHTRLPIAVGFGIRDADSAARISQQADGVVVGSALVSRIAENTDNIAAAEKELETMVSDMRTAMDAAAKGARPMAEGEKT